MHLTNHKFCINNFLSLPLIFVFLFALTSCEKTKPAKPDFDAALQKHFAAISNRDIEAFKAHLTRDKILYTVVQNGHAFTTRSQLIEVHDALGYRCVEHAPTTDATHIVLRKV